jgi:hypothetical protein
VASAFPWVITIVALQSATFYREFGNQRLVLEGDTLQVVQTLWKEDKNLSKYGHIIEETRWVLRWEIDFN